ncbi:hypothetical protein KP509_11G078200 [Ceratopteris richardii]|uniref:F-box protein n=1 Tax=Ceratopteris richardii TaxID=49495 RepID=A0A8T2TQX6_CERRI|nr:hypothetical protein KP509_11G078200 [Ceratopteris richardii]KAH7425932.1 hypothetical protein KP509_11G078200 [Ceratopteris richardii]
MLLKAVRGKGLGNKIDPNKGVTAFPVVCADLTAGLSDELLLHVLSHVSDDPYPCSLVCKRWLRLHGMLKPSLKLKEWRFLESGRMTTRFPNLADVDLSGAWLSSRSKPNKILFTHNSITINLCTNAYDPDSIERFIEDQQVSPSSLDRGIKLLADNCPGLQRLCLIDVRRPTYNYNSFRRREVSKTNGVSPDLNDQYSQMDAKFNSNNVNEETNRQFSWQQKVDVSPSGGLAYLAQKCPTLQELVLNQCTDESLYAISAFENLQILRLVGTVSGFYHCTFTDVGLTILAKGCSRLVKLELSGCEASYDGISAIGQCCFMLEELTLSNQGLYEGWIGALHFCGCLKTLRLESCKQIDPIPGPSEHVQCCPALEVLELVRCNLRDKAGFSALVSVAASVKELCFQDCWGLDDETFKLLETCRQVRILSLEGCALLTTGGLEALVMNWKDLHTLRVVYCNSIKDTEITPALALTFSTLKELKWRPDTKSLLADCLLGTGVGQIGGKFFKRGGPS